ncbi:MAG TPA: hypothetical protein VGH44_05830 [Candidatus Saccharimonadia bacterium]|jgi:hypothetical protein
MHPERDIRSVRFVGSLSLMLGMVLMILTLVAALFALLSGIGSDQGSIVHWAILFIVALVMAATMMGCGAQLQRARNVGYADIENIRMIWTSEVIVMALGIVLSISNVPPLGWVGILMLVLLFTIRGAIIRLSGRF